MKKTVEENPVQQPKQAQLTENKMITYTVTKSHVKHQRKEIIIAGDMPSMGVRLLFNNCYIVINYRPVIIEIVTPLPLFSSSLAEDEFGSDVSLLSTKPGCFRLGSKESWLSIIKKLKTALLAYLQRAPERIKVQYLCIS